MEQREAEIIGNLQRADFRITPQRRRIIHHILTMPAHFSADDLLAVLREQEVQASRATVYRLLSILIESGILREVIYGEGHSHYELLHEEQEYHGHLICERCGRVIDFICPAVEGAIIGVSREYNFKHHAHTLQICGLCEECQRTARQ